MNVIFHIQPRKVGPIWLFDDPQRGLKSEPFVLDASVLIDKLVEVFELSSKQGPISLLFGAAPFPGAVELRRVKSQDEGNGVIYRWEEHELDGWLCPAFFCYFNPKDIPQRLYAMAAE